MPFVSDYHNNLEKSKFKREKINIDDELKEKLKEECVDKKQILINEWLVKKKFSFDNNIIFCRDSKNDRLFSFLLFGSISSVIKYFILPFTMILPKNFPVDPPEIKFMFKSKSLDDFFNCVDVSGTVRTTLLGNNFSSDFSDQKEWDKKTDGFIEIIKNMSSIFNSSEPFMQTLMYDSLLINNETLAENQKKLKSDLFNLRIFMFVLKNCVIELINTLEVPNNELEHFRDEIINHFKICKKPLTKIILKKGELNEFLDSSSSSSNPKYIIDDMEKYLSFDGIPFQTLIDMSIERINDITK